MTTRCETRSRSGNWAATWAGDGRPGCARRSWPMFERQSPRCGTWTTGSRG